MSAKVLQNSIELVRSSSRWHACQIAKCDTQFSGSARGSMRRIEVLVTSDASSPTHFDDFQQCFLSDAAAWVGVPCYETSSQLILLAESGIA